MIESCVSCEIILNKCQKIYEGSERIPGGYSGYRSTVKCAIIARYLRKDKGKHKGKHEKRSSKKNNKKSNKKNNNNNNSNNNNNDNNNRKT